MVSVFGVKILCNMLSYIINNKSLTKVEDVKQYKENNEVQNAPHLAYDGCPLLWPTEA
jgi:hypothetical protein